MNKASRTGLIVVAVLVVLYIILKAPYNTLVARDQDVQQAWSQVQNDLQRRNDLIPNLVNTVKGITGQERAVFGQIADARARIGGGGGTFNGPNSPASGPTPEKIQASNDLSSAISRLLVITENYPQLQSSQNFRDLQYEISGTENRLAHSREQYNGAVRSYNGTAKSFPAVFYARMLGFKTEEPYFQAPTASQQVPTVDFSDKAAPAAATP